jgi:hypothetical protein
LYLILLILIKYKRFKVLKDEKAIAIWQIGRKKKQLSFHDLEEWSEDIFYFRNQQKRTIKMQFRYSENYSVSDKDDLMQYEELFHFLRLNYKKIENK